MAEHSPDRRGFLLGASALALAESAVAGSDVKPVRVAVVGSGGRGCDLIRALTTIDRAELVAVCDDYAPHLERGLKYAGTQAKGYTRYTTMLAEVRPQAVVIATPLHLHHEMSLQAIRAGCAVFCEKTMCHTVAQARELAATVKKEGAIFQVGLQRRANAVYRQAAAMVETGMLGKLTAIKCQWHRNGSWRRPVPVKRDDARFRDLERRLNWRLYRAFSGGLMTELASHQLDVATWLLGTPPRRVVGTGGIDHWRDGREVFDNVFCVYDHEMKRPGEAAYTVRVTYSSLQTNAYEGASELVMGTKGTLFLTPRKGLFFREGAAEEPGWSKERRADEDAAVITSGKTLKLSNDPWAHRGKPFEIDAEGDDTRDELVAFLKCVAAGDRETICTAADGLVNVATVLAGVEAMTERKSVEVAVPPLDQR